MTQTVQAIAQALDALAPPALAESWDNVGLLVGDPRQAVQTVLVALDVTPGALEQAAEHGAELIVTHHPLIFSGLKRLIEDAGVASLVRRMIADGQALVSCHTNLDSAPHGLNTYVAAMLDLRDTRPLVPSTAHPLLKLVVYVPVDHVDAVREAICAAGAGQIGAYSDCTFTAAGTGTFRPGEGTSPFIGTVGELERVAEVRLETVVPRARLGAVLTAMLAAHPYEEAAFDVLPLDNAWPDAGLGRIGHLEQPATAGEMVDRIRELLWTERSILIGDPSQQVRTVALCTGAGGDYITDALRAGADLYLTAEVKHHQALLARQRGLPVIDAGHFATERPAVDLLAGYLLEQFPDLTVICAEESDPFSG